MNFEFRTQAPAFLALLALAACGGGGGGSGGGAAAPLATNVSLSGTAATGAAIAGGTVEVKCAGGNTASTTTSSTGGYSVTVTAAALPCVVRVTSNGATLHSVIETGAALPAVANVTPLTELLTSQIAGATASSFFNTFDAAAQARLTPAAVTTATTNVATALAGVIDISGDDLLRGSLVPAVDGSGGNLADQKLDALALALTEAGSSVAAVAQALVSSPGAPPPILASVPLAASSCPALRSGRYVGVYAADPQVTGSIMVLDARTLVATAERPSTIGTVTFTAAPGEPCRFSGVGEAGMTQDLLVSKSGLAVSRVQGGGALRTGLAVLLPAQTISLADLAGTWNSVSYERSAFDGLVYPENGTFTLSASGDATADESFDGLVSTGLGDPGLSFVTNSAGGFNVAAFGVVIDSERFFAFRAPDGNLTLVGTGGDSDENLAVARREENVVPRAVGVVLNFWDVSVRATTEPVVGFSDTIVATDTTSTPKTETRVRASNNRVDMRSFNTPRQGLRYRAPGSCTTGVGGPATPCFGAVSIDGQGTGLSAAAGVGPNSFFSLSVIKP